MKSCLLAGISLLAASLSLPGQTNNPAPLPTDSNPNDNMRTNLITNGQRVFTCGHSFHSWVPPLLKELANAAGITNHVVAGVSSIGGSSALAHWKVADDKNRAKAALTAGKVDVLTLSCFSGPDEGIRNFAKLAVEHNPNVRVTLQELWLPEDCFPFITGPRAPHTVNDFNGATLAGLEIPHAAYFKAMEDYVRALNAELGKPVVFIVPDAQATLALRERIIAGTAPGLKKQSELFADSWGHPTVPLKVLSAYCHFAVIYRRSPVGLPMPRILMDVKNPQWDDKLNRLLQELAWEAVTHHPLSGV
ncbi:MAG: hypothetical protein WCH84_04745 [Verrucomicrobiota bacterium]